MELVVNDGSLDSDPDTVTITTENTPPVADAGDDQTVQVGEIVQLDGSGSTDVDGDLLTYQWAITTKPEFSLTALSDPTAVNPTFEVDAAGTYIVQLVVNDGTANSDSDSVTVTTENSQPTAYAGEDQTVLVGTRVQLDGSGSSDPDTNTLTFAWSLTTVPTGSSATLSDPTVVNPTFEADLLGEYVAQLIVNDGTLDSEPDTVSITTENSRPVAEAGEDQLVTQGDTVVLDGSGSTDADGHTLTFDWSLISVPAGSGATIVEPDLVEPTFEADLPGIYVPQLIVSDSWEDSDPDTTTVTAEPLIINTPPVADAGDDQTVTAGTTVFLDGSGSHDDDDDTITYTWSFVAIPDGSNAVLSGADTVTPNFTPDLAGDYQVQLIVHDGTEPSNPDLVSVTAEAGNQPPVADAGVAQTVTLGKTVHLDGSASEDPDGDPITHAWSLTTRPAGSSAVLLAADTTTPYFKPDLAGGYEATLVVNDGADDSLPDSVAITVNEEVVTLPPDPATVAPPPDPTIATTVFDATQFLYTGDDPIQTGVEPGTIDPERVTVLRGHIRDAAGAPLPGVTVTVLDRPEYGQTLTRTDGMFDLTVNGGGPLVLDYRKTSYLAVQRHVETAWQDYVGAVDAVMLQRDAQVTAVEFGDDIQVARGSVSTDDDGSRQVTLLFPGGTTATLEFPDGSTQPIDTLHVRATEFTVGEDGPDAMPAELPPQVGYTYCVEFSVDEAEALGAEHVQFSEPLPVYLENFLGFPVGGDVPIGYYDAEQGTWVPYPNGRIVEVLDVQDGLALLDVDGSRLPADTAALAELGIADAEREQVAALYAPGQSLWRTPIPHFSPGWDFNWGMGPPLDAIWPTLQAEIEDRLNDMISTKNQCLLGLTCIQNQTLGEIIPVTGTPFGLYYQSERVPGRTADRILDIPVTGDEVPASMKRVELGIGIGGRRFEVEFPATPNQSHTFAWDGLDAYGQPLLGTHPVDIKVNYVYDLRYMNLPDLFAAFGYAGDGPVEFGGEDRSEIKLGQEWQDEATHWDARGQGLGGFTVSPHHAYDPVGKILYRGDGAMRITARDNNIIETIAEASRPVALAVAPDGTLYVGESGWVKRVNPDGTSEPIARPPGGSIQDLALSPDGALYVSNFYDSGIYYTQYCYIARLEPDGTFTIVAGSPEQHGCGFSGDGGPATEAQLRGPHQIAFGTDGSLYITDRYNYRIRKISLNGIIQTVAGTGEEGFSEDGTPAIEAQLSSYPVAVTIGTDGALHFVDYNLIRRINGDGTLETVAGGGSSVPDGVIATDANVGRPYRLNFAPDGSLYADTNSSVVKVSPDGIANIVAGTWGVAGFEGDGGPPVGALLNIPYEVLPFGGLFFIADRNNDRIRRVVPALPGFSASDIAVASTDGAMLYRFDANGRHLETVNTLTAAVLYTFTYDDNGLLTRIEDGDGNVTTIERDSAGNPLAIVAPFGQRTELALDPDGYLASVTDPMGLAYGLTYSVDGLLATVTDPRQEIYRFTYDDQGRLVRNQDPAGGDTTLALVREDDHYTVAVNTAEGRASNYLVQVPPTLDDMRVNTFPDNTQNEATFGNDDGTSEILYADGIQVNRTETGDRRFWMAAPVTKELTIGTPGGLSYLLNADRTVVLTDPNDLLSLATQTDTVTINGRTFTSLYDAATRTSTTTTPAGRQTTATTDLQGRPTLVQIPGIEPIGFAYDALGRLEQLSDGTRFASFAYDPASGYLANTTNALSEATTFARDLLGRVTSLTLPDTTAWGYSWDENGNLLTLTEPDGNTAHQFTYTTTDRLATYTSPLGATETFSYNLDGELIRREYPSTNGIDWIYNAGGQLTAIQTPEGNDSFTYDAATGQLTRAVSRDGQIIDYTYDGGLLTSATWSGLVEGQVSYTYDNELRVTQLDYAGLSLPIGYDTDGLVTAVGTIQLTRDPANGLLTQLQDGDFLRTYAYNTHGELSHTTASHDGTVLYEVSYTYDDLGRISRKVESIEGATHTFEYAYDAIGQLVEVKRDTLVVENYQYDEVGNRIGMTNLLTGVTLTAGDYEYDDDNKLLRAESTTYQYDPDGRLVEENAEGQVTRYQYNTDGTLGSVELPNSSVISYLHNSAGERIGRAVDAMPIGSWLYGNGMLPLTEYDGDGILSTTYVYATGSSPVLVVRDGNSYHIVADHLGSIRLVIDATGTVTKRVEYDAYGNRITDTNPSFALPMGFVAGIADQDHELVRFGARDYSPSAGRWTAKDPIHLFRAHRNPYDYVHGDPVNSVDRSGLMDFFLPIIGREPLGIRRNKTDECLPKLPPPNAWVVTANVGAGWGGGISILLTEEGMTFTIGGGIVMGSGYSYGPAWRSTTTLQEGLGFESSGQTGRGGPLIIGAAGMTLKEGPYTTVRPAYGFGDFIGFKATYTFTLPKGSPEISEKEREYIMHRWGYGAFD